MSAAFWRPTVNEIDPHSAASAGISALLVDDDQNYAAYVRALLRRVGIHADCVTGGEKALRAVELRSYDLLLIDCEMPGLSGLELIPKIRAAKSGSSAYSIMLTAREDVETKIAALRAGFDDFLLKSTTEIELVAKIVASHRMLLRQQHLDRTVRELYSLATRDELTGLFNRRFFFDEAQEMLKVSTLTLVLFDLDDFKQVNDRWGHLAGDQVLRDAGEVFARGTRPTDFVARFGGDEFVMVVENTALPEAESMAERIATRIRHLRWSGEGREFSIGVSYGMATTEYLPSGTLVELLIACDHDLYKNKWLRSHPGDAGNFERPQGESRLIDFPEAGRSRIRRVRDE